MVFSANPLSLSVPEPAFESWLRDSGYLEVLDHRASSAATTISDSATTATAASTITSSTFSITGVVFSHLLTLLSLFTFNPFSKLTAEDFAAPTPSWTYGFVGSGDSYSFPSSPAQARLRVHENVKRYARNYATLFVLIFASTLYQMPLALVGLISCLILWDVIKFCGDKWGLDQRPVIRQCLVGVAQCASAVILMYSNVQMSLFYALSITYAGMILHATFRKLTPAKQPSRGRSK